MATGTLGSLGGGLLLDALGPTLRNAARVCGGATLAGCVLMLCGFLATSSFGAFMAVFALGELALFAIQAPVGAIGMWAVPPALRPLAISLTTVSIHVLGDVPSPPLVGWLETKLEEGKTPEEAAQQWRYSIGAVTTLLAASGAVFLLAARLAGEGSDYRKLAGSCEDGGGGTEGDASMEEGGAAAEGGGERSGSGGGGSARTLQQRVLAGGRGSGQQRSDRQPLLDPASTADSSGGDPHAPP